MLWTGSPMHFRVARVLRPDDRSNPTAGRPFFHASGPGNLPCLKLLPCAPAPAGMINPSTARLALSVALLGSAWAILREYLRYQESRSVEYSSIFLAFVVPAVLYIVIRVNRR